MLEGEDGGTDILLFNFGLHDMHWQRPHLIRRYNGTMRAILMALKENVIMSTSTTSYTTTKNDNATDSGLSASTTNTANINMANERNQKNKFKLLLFRETTAQHFPFPGGDWGDGMTCSPLNFTSANEAKYRSVAVPFYREVILRKAAWDTGYRVFTVGPAAGQGGSGGGVGGSDYQNGASGRLQQLLQEPQEQAFSNGNKNNNEPAPISHPDIVMLPFAKFTSELYDLHPHECTHYCSTPFLWMPLWRSFRLAMEWKFGG
jgi:hypothetical protein